MSTSGEAQTKQASALERLLGRTRIITLLSFAALCFLAWIYLLASGGVGASTWDTIATALFPHLRSDVSPAMAGMVMPGMEMGGAQGGPPSWSISAPFLMLAMWSVMMIGMMTPGVAPTILFYAKVHRHAAEQWQLVEGRAPVGVFLAGYFAIWLGFSVLATGLHWALEQMGLISAAVMDSRSRWLSASLLIAAGFYELSPLKSVCLAHCREPSDFLSRYWSLGAGGAFQLGARHGLYCVGCCWALMALLFVGGVMNPVWIAALAILVLLEKAATGGVWISRAVGVLFIVWGVATFFV